MKRVFQNYGIEIFFTETEDYILRYKTANPSIPFKDIPITKLEANRARESKNNALDIIHRYKDRHRHLPDF